MPQGQLSEEDLKNMSPEEIQELQKKQCIFCHIVSGKVSSKKIYEDDTVLAILDINPANPGHVLLMPKEHYSIMPQLPEETVGHIFTVAKHISQALLRALKVSGTNIFVANGIAAGQKAAHFMIHVIPRKEGDGLALEIPEGVIKEQDLEQLKNVISNAVGGTLGGTGEELPEKIEPKRFNVEKAKVVDADFEEEQKKESEIDLDAISALVATKGSSGQTAGKQTTGKGSYKKTSGKKGKSARGVF